MTIGEGRLPERGRRKRAGVVYKLVLQRLGLGILTLFAASVLIFIGTELLPGDLASAILQNTATPESLAKLRLDLGLDRPAILRFVDWLWHALRGDFGVSLTNGRDVLTEIAPRFANTMFLAAYAAVVAVPLAIGLGLLAAIRQGGVFDRLANVTPESSFIDRLYYCFLPMLTLVLVIVAHMMRMTRASVLSVMASPYIEMAILKGLTKTRIVVRHALPNALAPIISVVALNLAYLIVGVVVVETVFVYPGLGQLMVDNVPVVQACGLIFAAT